MLAVERLAYGNFARWWAIALFSFAVEATYAQKSVFPPLNRSNFVRVDPGQGFNDRHNSWAWSMEQFKGKLFVGTNRAMQCVNAAAINKVFPDQMPYPPLDPDISCTPDYRDLPLQAEIWALEPFSNTWTRVYKSPADVPIPNTNPQKYVARDQGFRGMKVFTEPDGTQALYVGSCSTRVIYGNQVNVGRLLRSTDGINFTPVPQDPGTFLGNIGNACFRGIQSMNGKLYAVATDFQGAGFLVESANPKLGNNSFRQISPFGAQVYEFGVYNDALYVSISATNGFSVLKTSATGNLPYTYVPIMVRGGYKPRFPNRDVLSMKEFKGRLYVGANGVQTYGSLNDVGAELFRINPDDSWDLLVGQSRSTPVGYKYALSGLGLGFGWNLNEHMWRMEVYDGRLYIGTFDAATVLRNNPDLGPELAPHVGGDLWYTSDGVYFANIDEQGWQDKFNFGNRSLMATPFGLFVGTANYFYGLQLWKGTPVSAAGGMLGPAGSPKMQTTPDPPTALQVEPGLNKLLLSWSPSQRNAKRYSVYRWSLDPVATGPTNSPLMEDVFWWYLKGIGTGVMDGVPVPLPSTRVLVGTTDKTVFVDSTIAFGKSYGYEVVADNGAGGVSGPSNYVTYPSQMPLARFPDVWVLLRRYVASNTFTSPANQQLLFQMVTAAEQAAAVGNYQPLIALLQKINQLGGTLLKGYSSEDLAILLQRLVQRGQLVTAGVLPASSLM